MMMTHDEDEDDDDGDVWMELAPDLHRLSDECVLSTCYSSALSLSSGSTGSADCGTYCVQRKWVAGREPYISDQ